jgi:hypothetical protein
MGFNPHLEPIEGDVPVAAVAEPGSRPARDFV